MKQEYSYGAVVYEKRKNNVYILIEYMKQGHISLPKGHIEKGETPEQCALREIKEETDLNVSLNTEFRHTISYKPSPSIKKDVTFFLATPTSNHIKAQESEVSHIEWMEEERALLILTHDTDKEVLKDALKYIHSHEEK